MKAAWALIATFLAADVSLPYRPGLIRGTIRVVDPPRRKLIRMDADPEAAALHQESVWSEEVVVDPENGVKGAFVYVKKGLEGRRFPMPPAVVLKHDKALFQPRILGLRAGQDLKIRNEDDFLHCTHAFPYNNREFNFGQRSRGMEETKRFDHVEIMVPVKCDVHPWERGWIGVIDHPFFAITESGGTFELKDVPPGRYTIEVWQERYKPVSREIEVRGRGPLILDFTLVEKK